LIALMKFITLDKAGRTRMTVKAILFDFDGVIVESVNVKTDAFREMFANESEHLPAILAFHLANGGMSRFTKFEIIYRDFLQRSLSPQESEDLGKHFSELVKEKVVASPYVPGALEFIEKYASSTPLFIASGTPHNELVEILSRRNLDGFFCEAHGTPRTKTEIIQDILERHDMTPIEMPFIGDAMNDYKAAVQIGLSFYGRVSLGAVNPFPSDIPVFPDLTELEHYIF
jgi:phosphoglycolate phosphatase-like HAD superfamily hydrolase